MPVIREYKKVMKRNKIYPTIAVWPWPLTFLLTEMMWDAIKYSAYQRRKFKNSWFNGSLWPHFWKKATQCPLQTCILSQGGSVPQMRRIHASAIWEVVGRSHSDGGCFMKQQKHMYRNSNFMWWLITNIFGKNIPMPTRVHILWKVSWWNCVILNDSLLVPNIQKQYTYEQLQALENTYMHMVSQMSNNSTYPVCRSRYPVCRGL